MTTIKLTEAELTLIIHIMRTYEREALEHAGFSIFDDVRERFSNTPLATLHAKIFKK